MSPLAERESFSDGNTVAVLDNPVSRIFKLLRQHPAVLPILFAAAIGLLFQGARGLYDPTEGRYALSALEMFKQQNLLQPRLDGAANWESPPFFYWTLIAGLSIFGRTEWAVRLPNAAVYVLTCIAVVFLGQLAWNRRAGLAAGLVYATAILPAIAANVVSPDTILSFWITGGMLGYAIAYRSDRRAVRTAAIVGTWMCFGFALLTSGLALVPVLIALLLWNSAQRKRVVLLHPLGLAVFALICGSWYFYILSGNPDLTPAIFWRHLGLSADITDFHPNSQWYGPFVVYLPTLFLGAGIWPFYVLRLRQHHPASFRLLWRETLRLDRLPSLFLAWTVLPLPALIFAPTRLPLYVLPLFPGIALVLGGMFRRSIAQRRRLLQLLSGCALTAIVVILIKLAAVSWQSPQNMRPLLEMIRTTTGDQPITRVASTITPLHGLSFYLDQPIERLSLAGESRPSRSLQALLEELRRTPGAARVVLITDRSSSYLVHYALIAQPVQVTPAANQFWRVFVLTKTPQEW